MGSCQNNARSTTFNCCSGRGGAARANADRRRRWRHEQRLAAATATERDRWIVDARHVNRHWWLTAGVDGGLRGQRGPVATALESSFGG
jgi:hypothetical protein